MIGSQLTYLLCIGVVFAAPAPPSSNQTKILGVWEITKSDDGTPTGTTIEFAKDGKVKVTTKAGDLVLNLEGTYKVEGDKLTVTIKPPNEKEQTDTVTITKLTDKVLIIKDEKGKIDEFKKKK
jgi:uncharacterized protein (TIGR03066 family)